MFPGSSVVEQVTVNHLVAGSNPARGATIFFQENLINSNLRMNDEHFKYRPEIDGLRAIAVLAVIFFHAHYSFFPGGFIGVDIFFVISGYLITSILLKALETDSFSLINFYERRIRRIIPALSFMMAVSVIVFAFVMPPYDYINVGESLLATAFFVSNLYFMRQEGYFDAPADIKPLLHTWSLAVEEQFYVIFPILLITLFYLGKRYSQKAHIFPTLLFVFFISFSLALFWGAQSEDKLFSLPFVPDKLFGNATYASANFYLFFSRAWELMAGALLSRFALRGCSLSPLFKEFLSFLGLLMIIVSFLFMDETFSFPGGAALPAVAGTMLFILSAQNAQTFAARILSSRPFVWIGKISYSLYLWHWPIFVFAFYVSFNNISEIEKICLILLSFLISVFSYCYVEMPIRRKTFLSSRSKLFVAGIGSLIILAVGGASISFFNGYPQRIPQDALKYTKMLKDKHARQDECFSKTIEDLEKTGACIMGNAEKEALSLLVWGDSHADSIMPVIEKLSRDYGIKSAIIAHGRCLPVFNVYHKSKKGLCSEVQRFVKGYIEENKPEHILLVGRWTESVFGPKDQRPGEHFFIKDQELNPQTPLEAQEVFLRNFKSTLDFFLETAQGVWVLQQAPEQKYAPLDALRIRMTGADMRVLEVASSSEHQNYNQFVLDSFENVRGNKIHILKPEDILCDTSICHMIANDKFLYRDKNHLNPYGAMHIEPVFTPLFDAARAERP